jgi:hypothetical protein
MTIPERRLSSPPGAKWGPSDLPNVPNAGEIYRRDDQRNANVSSSGVLAIRYEKQLGATSAMRVGEYVCTLLRQFQEKNVGFFCSPSTGWR